MITLYVNHYWTSQGVRQAELNECLVNNAKNPLIDRIVVLAHSTPSQRPKIDGQKVVWIDTDSSKQPYGRPTYQKFFDTINAYTKPDDLNIIANSDIYFDDTLAKIKDLDLTNVCLALTRWDHWHHGTDREKVVFKNANNSQDAWIFQGHVRPLGRQKANFPLGIFGCDNRIAWEIKNADYMIENPSRDVVCHHLHSSAVRFNGWNVGGPTREVQVCNLHDLHLSQRGQIDTGVISFALYGTWRRYLQGAVENAKLAREIYPGWVCRFYCDRKLEAGVLKKLQQLQAEVVLMDNPGGSHGMFWRLHAADDQSFTRFICRDVDSRLSYRERRAVDDWISSGLAFHAMRDHPGHRQPIMGGCWGGLTGQLRMKELIGNWKQKGAYGHDEAFLSNVIWPKVADRCLVHASFPHGGKIVRPFPTQRSNGRYVGERWHWIDDQVYQIDHGEHGHLLWATRGRK